MADRVVAGLDGWVGERIESAIRVHHRRRLRRSGQLERLDPPHASTSLWAAGDPPPRDGNELEVLIDGAHALPLLAQALADARSSIHIAGWHLTADFGLTRDREAMRLRDLLGELAERERPRAAVGRGAGAAVHADAGGGAAGAR